MISNVKFSSINFIYSRVHDLGKESELNKVFDTKLIEREKTWWALLLLFLYLTGGGQYFITTNY